MAFRPFTTSRTVYTIDSLLLDASIASYLTALISTNNAKGFKEFDGNLTKQKDYCFEEPDLNFLNRFARFPNGTLYYLKKAHELLLHT